MFKGNLYQSGYFLYFKKIKLMLENEYHNDAIKCFLSQD